MQLEIKSVGDDGTFEGVLSPYNNVDQGNDLVEPGAFTKSLAASGNVVPMLWQHKQDCPIGELLLRDGVEGLQCSGKFCLDTNAAGQYMVPEAAKAYALVRAKVVKGLSIGYDAVKAPVVEGVRRLKEIKLWEGSVVTFPMNLQAGVTAVKSFERKGEFADTLTDMQLSNQRYVMCSALEMSLNPLVWSGGTRGDILAAAEAIIDEFKSVYMEFLPTYLDFLAREYGLDTKTWQGQREQKAGRKISAETGETLKSAHEHMASAVALLAPLIDDEDADDADDDDDEMDDDEEKSLSRSIKSMRSLLA